MLRITISGIVYVLNKYSVIFVNYMYVLCVKFTTCRGLVDTDLAGNNNSRNARIDLVLQI